MLARFRFGLLFSTKPFEKWSPCTKMNDIIIKSNTAMITKCKYRFSLSFISANFINPSHSIKLKFWSKPSKFFLKFWSSVKIFSSDNLPNFYLTFDQLAKIYKFYRCKGLKTLADFNFSISLSCWLINAVKLIILELNFLNLAFLFYSWLIPCSLYCVKAKLIEREFESKKDEENWTNCIGIWRLSMTQNIDACVVLSTFP